MRLLNAQGPDVTLATNAFSTLSFNPNMEATSVNGHPVDMNFLELIPKPSRYVVCLYFIRTSLI